MSRVGLLVMALLWGSVAWAAEPLDGTWVLDHAASDSLDKLLVAQGVSTIERMIAKRITITHVIDDHGGTVDLRVESSLRSFAQTMTVDGVSRWEEGVEGQMLSTHHREGEVLVSENRGVTRENIPFVLVSRRWVDASGAMILHMTFTREGQAPLTAKRVFRKQ